MKNIFVLIAFLIGITLSAGAQSTLPRTGNSVSVDNTYRGLQQKYKAVTDAAGLDTVNLNLNAFHTLVKVSLTDSVAFAFPTISNCYYGDKVTITVTNSASGTAIRFAGANVQCVSALPSRLAITASKRANIVFIFDGVTWVEQSRFAQ